MAAIQQNFQDPFRGQNMGANIFDYAMQQSNADRGSYLNDPQMNPFGALSAGMGAAMQQFQSANAANQQVANARAMQQNQLNQQYNLANNGTLGGLLGNEANMQNQSAMQQANLSAQRQMNGDKYNFLGSLLPQLFGQGGQGGGPPNINTNYGAGVSFGNQSSGPPQTMGGMLNAPQGQASTGGQGGGSPVQSQPAAQQSSYVPSTAGSPSAGQGVAMGNTDWKPNNTMGSWTQGQQDPTATDFEQLRQRTMAGGGGAQRYGSPAKQPGEYGYRPTPSPSTGDYGADRRLSQMKAQPGYSPLAAKYNAATNYRA